MQLCIRNIAAKKTGKSHGACCPLFWGWSMVFPGNAFEQP